MKFCEMHGKHEGNDDCPHCVKRGFSIEEYETDAWACTVGVNRFAVAMKEKLAKKRAAGRGGWNRPSECSIEYLYKLLEEHERTGDLVDIANFCMMIWNRENPAAALARRNDHE